MLQTIPTELYPNILFRDCLSIADLYLLCFTYRALRFSAAEALIRRIKYLEKEKE